LTTETNNIGVSMGLFGMQRIIGRKPSDAPASGIEARAYAVWKAMIYKCFSHEIPKGERRQRNVSSRFKDFREFYRWYALQPGNELTDVRLNKDLLYRDNRVYSDATCVLLPKQIHEVLKECRITRSDLEALKDEVAMSPSTNPEKRLQEAYNEAKLEMEASLRLLAEKYRHMLDERAYKALVQFKVEIID
jgi:hypothetical protein